jgi:hypothetical protein
VSRSLERFSMNKLEKVMLVAGVVIVWFGAFLGGRQSVQRTVETKVSETQKQSVEERVKTTDVTSTVQDTAVRKDQVETVREVRRPDGTVETTRTTRHSDRVEARRSDEHQQVGERVRVETREVVRVEERRVEVTRGVRPDWVVGVMGGVSVPDLAGGGHNYIPGLPGYAVVGISAQHHFIGPVYAGAWATSQGAGGLSLSVAW